MVGATPERTTLAEKVWDAHVVRSADGEPDLLYIDLHLLHEVTSPQAFDGLRLAGRRVRRPDLTLATEDHNTPTGRTGVQHPRDNLLTIADPISRTQIETLRRNCAEFGVRLHPLGDEQPGHRARDRPAARAHPARHDDRLRRLAHRHARRVRRAGVRHRHQRGRARARHPDAAAGPAEDDGRQRHRRAAPGRHRQGPGAGADRPGRHRRRPRPRRGVPRRGHRSALHGGPDDHLPTCPSSGAPRPA